MVGELGEDMRTALGRGGERRENVGLLGRHIYKENHLIQEGQASMADRKACVWADLRCEGE